MAHPPAASRTFPLVTHPWSLILAGGAANVLAWFLGYSLPSLAAPRFLLVMAGMFTALAGLVLRFQQARWDIFLDRVETAAMVATTGTAALLAWFAMSSDWDSGRMLFGAVFIASVVGSVLVLVPSILRRILLSLIIIFHFGGMLTAITSIDPPNGTGPWVSKVLWARVYRPYLSFLYLTNAYHFYSPDPGSPSLLWFAVHYSDGTYKWVKLPERANSPIGMHYQRMLALPEHSFVPMPRLPFSGAELAVLAQAARAQGKTFEMPERGSQEEIWARRSNAGLAEKYPLVVKEDGKEVLKTLEMPMVTGMADVLQYREPHDNSKKLLAGLARRIFWNAPKSDKGGKVTSVKVYRLTHQVVTPAELAQGVDPLDKTKHWAYFMGEFDGQGKMVRREDGSLDPFLYWYLPIVHVDKGYPDTAQRAAIQGSPYVPYGRQPSKDTFLLDGLEMHAAGPVRQANNGGAKQ